MLEDELEALVAALAGRVVAVNSGPAAWLGRLSDWSTAEDKVMVHFEAADRPGTWISALVLSRQNTIRAAFEPAAGPADYGTPARLTVLARDGATMTITENDATARPARWSPPSTKQSPRGVAA